MSISKVVYTWDLSDELDGLDRSEASDALYEIGNYLVEAILADLGEAKSPVTGKPFKKLSAAYAKFKSKLSSSPIPNLELTGAMLDALTYEVRGQKILVGIWGDEAEKADGHNNFSGDSKLPLRPFIPGGPGGDQFRPDIRDGVQQIIDEALSNADVNVEA